MGYKSYHARFYCFIILKHAKIEIKNQIITELRKTKYLKKKSTIRRKNITNSISYSYHMQILTSTLTTLKRHIKCMISNYLMLKY